MEGTGGWRTWRVDTGWAYVGCVFEWKHEDGLSTRAVHMHQLRDHHKSESSQRVPVHVRS